MPAPSDPAEPPAIRLKRLRMRAWRRGTKEMDLILGPFADARLEALGPEDLDLFDALLGENDQDLYPWVTGTAAAPRRYAALLAAIAAHARDRSRGF